VQRPVVFKTRNTFTPHPWLKAVVNKKGNKAVIDGCRVPTKLKPISAFNLDKNNDLVVKKFDDLVVKECGCE